MMIPVEVQKAYRFRAALLAKAWLHQQAEAHKVLLRHYLGALGSSPSSVAHTLRKLGIKGYNGSIRRCPVAQYLRRNAVEARVDRNWVDTVHGKHVAVRTPKPVSAFIRAFDKGAYADLRIRRGFDEDG